MDVVVYNKIQQEADRLARMIEQGGGGADLAALEVYIADFLEEPPIVTEGALNAFHRTIVS